MKFYKTMPIDNLEILQQKVLDLFPNEYLDKTQLFYTDKKDILLKIPELIAALQSLGGIDAIQSTAFAVMQPMSEIPIHIDEGVFRKYSFNIPIKNCTNSFVTFYQNNGFTSSISNTLTYSHCDPSNCVPIDRFEMSAPHLIDVKHPHGVSNLNTDVRIALLLRLKHEHSSTITL